MAGETDGRVTRTKVRPRERAQDLVLAVVTEGVFQGKLGMKTSTHPLGCSDAVHPSAGRSEDKRQPKRMRELHAHCPGGLLGDSLSRDPSVKRGCLRSEEGLFRRKHMNNQ